MASYTTLVTFSGTDGSNPEGPLFLDAQGDLFGVTSAGGIQDGGTAFEIAATGSGYASTPTTITYFTGSDGVHPSGGLIADSAGNFYGLTAAGGGPNNQGTVYSLTPDAQSNTGYAGPQTLVSFNGTDGSLPTGVLVRDAAGDLFGVTENGGINGDGTVFELTPGASMPTVLVNFDGTDGATPMAGLAMDSAGNLFGTTYAGGDANEGTIFEVAKTASGYATTPNTLVNFQAPYHGPMEGPPPPAQPEGPLTIDAQGDLFGTTSTGGYGHGTVFEMTPSASGYGFTQLADFNGSDGATPIGNVTVDAAGDIFGETSSGGANGDGAVFEVIPAASINGATPSAPAGANSTIVDLHDFTAADGPATGGLTVDSLGNIFGTTPGTSGTNGTAFELSNAFETVALKGAVAGQTTTDHQAVMPFANASVADLNANQTETLSITLSSAANGTLSNLGHGSYDAATGVYSDSGTTQSVTADLHGLIFTPTEAQVAAGSNVTTDFAVTITDNIGATWTNDTTSVIATASPATETTLATFSGNTSGPQGVTMDSAGDLFGAIGGSYGTIFEIAKTDTGYASTPTTIANIGANPGFVIDSNGDIIASNPIGGSQGDGQIFELTPGANGYTETTINSDNGSYGDDPQGHLIADANGDIFGTTPSGGSNGAGGVWEMAKALNGYGAPVELAGMNTTYSPWVNPGVVINSAGDLFGTTQYGGDSADTGTVYEIVKTSNGYASTATIVYDFHSGDASGYAPTGSLLVDSAGNLYGTTSTGGAGGEGALFEIADNNGTYATAPTVLATFDGSGVGGTPTGMLQMDAAGNIFGTTSSGNADGYGGLFELAKTASGYSTTTLNLYAFQNQDSILSNTADAAGDLFLTSAPFQAGGGQSTVFELSNTGFAPQGASGGGGTTGETLTANDTAGQHLTGTPNDDTFYAGHNSVVMTGNGGDDTFAFQYLPWNAGSITDFNTAHDILDLSGIFASIGYTGSNPVGDGYLQFVSDGQGDTQVLVDTHQSSDPYPTLITTLDGVAPSSITAADYTYGSSSGSGGGGGGGTGGSATVSVISTFSGSPEPNGTLLVDSAGNLLGTTQSGGANGDGAIFEVANTGSGYAATPTIIASFDGSDGHGPGAGLIADSAGNLFGTTVSGGANGDGAIFELAKTADGYAAAPTLLASFGSDAVGPANQLVMDAAGDLFGITENGPFNATVFELAKTASGYAGAPTTLGQFDTPSSSSPLVIDGNGDLFGIAISKSGPSTGSVFEIAHTANGYAAMTTLATLGSADGSPSGALVADSAGDLFGLTNGGGANGAGEIFEIAHADGAYASVAAVLASFPAMNNHAGALLIDGAGDLFAQTLPSGGASGGELYELAHTASGYASTVTTVTGLDGGGISTMPGLAADSSGHLFGTALNGGPQQASAPNNTVYEITNSGFVPSTSGGGGGGGTQGVTLTADDSAGQHLTGTPYDDTFYAGHNSVVMTGEQGADHFIFQYEPWNAGSITDFMPGTDKLDVSALLSSVGYTGSNPVADGYLQFASDGQGDTQVLFHDPANQWPTLVTTLDGVNPSQITPADYGYGSSSGGGTGGGGGGTGGGGGGTGETLTANDTAGQQLTGTPYNDIFYAGHNSVVMTGNGGADQFIFQYLPWNAGSITDFNTAADVLNLKGIFASIGYTGSDPVADGYLAFHGDGSGDTQVIVNPQGPSTQIPITVTTLDHVDPSMIHSSDYVFA